MLVSAWVLSQALTAPQRWNEMGLAKKVEIWNEHRHLEKWGRLLPSTACVGHQVCVKSTFSVLDGQQLCRAAGPAGREKDEPGSTQESGKGAQPCLQPAHSDWTSSKHGQLRTEDKRLLIPVLLCSSKVSFSAYHVKCFASLNVSGITVCHSLCTLLPGFVLFR